MLEDVRRDLMELRSEARVLAAEQLVDELATGDDGAAGAAGEAPVLVGGKKRSAMSGLSAFVAPAEGEAQQSAGYRIQSIYEKRRCASRSGRSG